MHQSFRALEGSMHHHQGAASKIWTATYLWAIIVCVCIIGGPLAWRSQDRKNWMLKTVSCSLSLLLMLLFFSLWCSFFHRHTFLNHFLFKPTFLPSLCAAPSLHIVVFLKRTTWKHIYMCCIWTAIHSVEPNTCANTTTVPSTHIAYHSRYNSFKPRWVQ